VSDSNISYNYQLEGLTWKERSNYYCTLAATVMYGMSAHSYDYYANNKTFVSDATKDQLLADIDDAAYRGIFLPPTPIPFANKQLPLAGKGRIKIGSRKGFGYVATTDDLNDLIKSYTGLGVTQIHGVTIPCPTPKELCEFEWILYKEALNNLLYINGSYGVNFGTDSGATIPSQNWVEDSHPGVYYLACSASEAASAMWICLEYLFSDQNTTWLQPFPFLVVINPTNTDSYHALLVTGIQYDKTTGDKWFLVHDSGGYYETPYEPVPYDELVDQMKLDTPELGRAFQYLVAQENLSQSGTGSFVLPLFYDGYTLHWFIDEPNTSGGANARALAALVNRTIPLVPSVDANPGLYATRAVKPTLKTLKRELIAKQMVPILQLLLGD
jgi:hypothetical protein